MSVLIDYSSGAFAANKAQGVGSFNPLNDDGLFARVTLLMHMNGVNGSTSFPDASAYNQPSTVSGNAQVSTTQSRFGGSSAYFDGVGDYITINSGDAAYVSNSNFTIECWINYTFSGSSETRMVVISGGQTASSNFDYFQIAVKNNNSLRAEHKVYGTAISTPANSLTPNTWHHIALVRDSTSTRFYIDGVEEASTTAWASKILRTASPATVTIGHQNAETGYDNEYPGEYYKGYIDEVRVTKGVARYTSTFTPATLPFYKGIVTELDLSSGNYFNFTPSSDTEFKFINPTPSGTATGFLLQLNGANGSDTFTLADLTYDNISFSTSNEETSIKGLFWKPDGTRLYIVGFSGDDVNEYHCSTAYDITTATFNQAASVSGGGGNPSGIVFRDDGLRFYTCRAAAVDEFRLTTAWDVSTSSYEASTSVSANAAVGLAFKPDGTRFFVCQGSQSNPNNRKTLQYDLSTAWDITTSSYAGITGGNGPLRQTGMAVSNDGTRMFISNQYGQLVSYALTTPWDLTAKSGTASGNTSSQIGQCAISFSPDGSKFYAYQSSTVHQYSSSAVSPATFSYPASVEWPSGTAPDSPAIGETDVLVFLTDDGGVSYQGFQAGNAMSLPLAVSSPAFSEASELGTATQTITTFPNTNLTTTNSGLQDYTYATDFSTSSGNTGTIFELGGSTYGLNISLYNNLIEIQGSGTTNATGDFSSHIGETGTLYVSADYQNKIDVYWYSSNTMTLIVSTPTSGDYVGTDETGIAAVGGGYVYGTGRGNFSGTITEWRNWSNTYFDFSPFV